MVCLAEFALNLLLARNSPLLAEGQNAEVVEEGLCKRQVLHCA